MGILERVLSQKRETASVRNSTQENRDTGDDAVGGGDDDYGTRDSGGDSHGEAYNLSVEFR